MSNQTLSTEDQNQAKELYERFKRENPDVLNPTDMNTEEKYNFCRTITYEEYGLMQRARKQAYSFTRL
jgi:hypothetical protein